MESTRLFADRIEAGTALAQGLKPYQNAVNAIILALPRGGVPVGYAVAQALHLPLDVFVVRKLGVPGHPELAMGAIASGHTLYQNTVLIKRLAVSKDAFDQVLRNETAVLNQRETLYRQDRSPLILNNRTVLLVDDGIATGATMHAAILALRSQNPKKIVIAVPVAAEDTLTTLECLVDEIICLLTPSNFCAVGYWYEDFSQTTDAEVQRYLKKQPNI